MLPGFRFLFAAIVMCMSVLVFGLGAAALFRAAHEDFASNPTWRAPPEPHFAETTKTVLAVLSVQPPAPGPATDAATAGPTAVGPVAVGPAAEQPSLEPQTALSPTEPASPPEATQPAPSASEDAAAQSSTQTEIAVAGTAAEARADAPAPESSPEVAVIEDKPSSVGQVSSSVNAAALTAAQPEPVTASATPRSTEAATKIATLGGPPVMTDEIAAARASDPKLDRSEINKRLRAEHAREQRRRRLAAFRRARLAQQAAALQLLMQNPFTPHPLVGPPPTPAR